MTQSTAAAARTTQTPRRTIPKKESTPDFAVLVWPVLIVIGVIAFWRRRVRRANMTVDQRLAEDAVNELRRIRHKMR